MKKRRQLFPDPLPQSVISRPVDSPQPPLIYTLLAIGLLLLVIAGAWRNIDAAQVLFNMRAGETIIRNRMLPDHDTFSAGSTKLAWVYLQWGWAVISAFAYRAGEWIGVNILNVGVAALAALLLCLRARRHGSGWFEAAVVSGIVMALLLPGWKPDPLSAALVLFLVCIRITESWRLWPLFFIPFLTVLWANLHPAYLLAGLATLARLAVPPPPDPSAMTPDAPASAKHSGPHGYLFIILLGCIAASFITPHSIYIVRATADTLVHSAQSILHHPGDVLRQSAVQLRLAGIVILGIMLLAGRRNLLGWEWVVAGVLFAGAAISADSLTFLLFFLSAPAAAALSRALANSWRTKLIRQAAAISMLLLVCGVGVGSLLGTRVTRDAFGAGIRPDVFPETAAGRLAAIAQHQAILNSQDDGGYLVWRLWPGWKICTDARPTLYSEEFRDQYDLLWEGAENWSEQLNLWNVAAVLGTPEVLQRFPSHNLYYRLADSPDWTAVYWDSESILYVKSSIRLTSSNLQPFRQLKPGISWAAMKSRITNPDEGRELAADLRRALLDDPDNAVAQEFYRRAVDAGWK